MSDAVQSKAAPTLEEIERIEGALLNAPQTDMPIVHRFAPGVYVREIFMPKGTFVIGHRHNTEHFNIVLSGKANVIVGGGVLPLEAGAVFVSPAGVRKILYILEDMRWLTVHPTDETNVQTLEAQLITKSGAYLSHEQATALTSPERKPCLLPQ